VLQHSLPPGYERKKPVARLQERALNTDLSQDDMPNRPDMPAGATVIFDDAGNRELGLAV
jgi:hypothetical protein